MGTYRRHASLAVAVLLLFAVAYGALAACLLFSAWQHLAAARPLLAVFAFLPALAMAAALKSIKAAPAGDLVEVSACEQPRLFSMLDDLAHAAGAARPYKVYLSARVNASVFQDAEGRSLEIGLALVNSLTLGELRAVLAHEFGHLAQHAVAPGRWACALQRVASGLVSQRGAIGNPALWAVRTLLETLYRGVALAQRALLRDLELQADLTAVAVTGSDALVHALQRMQGADDAWERARTFALGQIAAGKAVADIFAVHTHMLERLRAIVGTGAYSPLPPLPVQGAAQHRVFAAALAQPPRRWLTHPPPHERETNAKRVYRAAHIDPASAWTLFARAPELRAQLTAILLGGGVAASPDESLATVAQMFSREQYHPRYHGVYTGRALTRHASQPGYLADTRCAPATLYPATLADDMRTLRELEAQHVQLCGLMAGTLTAPGGVVCLHGQQFRSKQLPAALGRVQCELAQVLADLHQHDRLCRSWHQQLARTLGGGWQPYLQALLALLHYAEHTLALLHKGPAALVQVHRLAAEAQLPAVLAARLGMGASWQQALGGARDGAHVASCFDALRAAALELLLESETRVACMASGQQALEAAPAPAVVPLGYAVLLQGSPPSLPPKPSCLKTGLAGSARVMAALVLLGLLLSPVSDSLV